jgi:hypothetical protein
MMCSLVVIIPVGPGHEAMSVRAADSVRQSAQYPELFTSVEVALIDDSRGALGRSAARNKGMDEHPADWHFFLDADDRFMEHTCGAIRKDFSATFGRIYIGRPMRRTYNRYPLTRNDLFVHGPRGTLSMGCFVRGDLGIRFDETLDIAEDFDFYLRLPDFIKIAQPLVEIGYTSPSAGGPRGVPENGSDWIAACQERIDYYRAKELGT